MSFLEQRGMLELGFYESDGEIQIDPRSPKCWAVNQPEFREFYYGTSPSYVPSLLVSHDSEPTVPSYSQCTYVINDDGEPTKKDEVIIIEEEEPIKEDEVIIIKEEEEELAKLVVEIERLQKRKAEIEAISAKRARK